MKLSIVILSYNTKDLLKQTIDSITMKPEWEMIIVDNASADESVAMVKKDYPWVKLIENKENVGFGRANNQAMRIAKGDYYFILNSDTEVKEDAIDQLLVYMDKHPKVAAITPKVVLKDGAIDPACHRGMPTPWRSFTYFSGLEKLFPSSKLFGGYHQTYLGLNTIHEIETTAATAMIVRKTAVDEIGMFDEAFFLYGEDLDWCKRMTDGGWKIVYYPKAIVVHYKSQSGKKHKAKKTKSIATIYFYDTMKQFYEKHYKQTYPAWLRWLVYKGIDFKKWQATR